MDKDVIFRYKNGRIIPIRISSDKTTNDYMNNFIRNKGKEKDYKGHLVKDVDTEAYYQLENGEKINFLNKNDYKKMTEDFYKNLTDDEKKALDIWVSDPHYMTRNPAFTYDKDYDKIMDNIFQNKAIALQEDTLLFRRASDDYLDLKNGVNSEYALSTSAYDKIPKTMPSGVKFGDKELYIIAPKGTKVLPIEKFAVNAASSDSEKLIYARQHEIVLPKKTSYELVEDLSIYYYRSPKLSEIHPVAETDQRYVIKLTDKKYDKANYEKPKNKYYWSENGYEKYIYKHKGKDIEINEKNMSSIYDKTKKTRSEAIKYQVWEMAFKGKDEYYNTYDEAVNAIEKYL